MKGTPWSRADLKKLHDLRTNKLMKWCDIAKEFPGRSEATLSVTFFYYRDKETGALKLPEPKMPPVRKPKEPLITGGSLGLHDMRPVRIPPDIIIERDARASLNHTSLTAAFFGDPKPGHSALDKRGNGDAR